MAATTTIKQRRAIGIVRVSEVKGRDRERDGNGFHSPDDQRERIRQFCREHDFRLVGFAAPELDVSGGLPLADRPGLREAVELVEGGRIEVVVAGWQDRLEREPAVRDELVNRVEAMGGEVWAVDTGQQTNATAAQQLTGTLASAVAR